MKMKQFSLASVALSLTLSLPVLADDFDVDDADSLDFESFHEEKEGALKVWEHGDGMFELAPKAEKIFEQKTADTQIPVKSQQKAASKQATHNVAQEEVPEGNKGKRYEIRERYSLGKSAQTPYSAFYVIEALHQQMAGLCPNGWTKIREFSVPVDSDFYLHYQFECR